MEEKKELQVIDMDLIRQMRKEGKSYEANRLLDLYNEQKNKVKQEVIENIRTTAKIIKHHFLPYCKGCGKKCGTSTAEFCTECHTNGIADQIIRKERLEKNLCTYCGKIDMTYSKYNMCEECRIKTRKYYTVIPKSKCQLCGNETHYSNAKYCNQCYLTGEPHKIRYKERKEKGLCVKCGKNDVSKIEQVICETCHKKTY